MSLWPVGRFLSHFIFILLTKLFKYYLKLLTTTELPLPLTCKPLARREEKNKEMERRRTKQWGTENEMMGEGE